MKNPLRKRLLRELKSEIGKYLVIFLLLMATIGFVSGFLVADGSMIKAYNESFEKYNIEIQGRHAVVIGRSNMVGKPLSVLLLNENATVTMAHSKTKNLSEIAREADILISATGICGLVKKDFVKDGAVVVDVGITRDFEGKIKGDVDFEEVSKTASFITPVPGGVGPMTIAMLMENTLELCLNNAEF